MKIDKDLTAKLAYTADSTNSVGGGMSPLSISSSRKTDHYLVDLKMPGVTSEDLLLEINEDLVLLFLNVDADQYKKHEYLLTYFRIPFDVNPELIEADFESSRLHITMPFKELDEGNSRIVNIKK